MEDFAKLLEENLKQKKGIEPGSLHICTILRDFGGFFFIRTEGEPPVEGIVSKEEFSEELHRPKTGDRLRLYFLRESSGDCIFTHCLCGDEITHETLGFALQYGIPVRGQVAQSKEDGCIVKLGEYLGFCPASQWEPDLRGLDLTGRKFEFAVLGMERKKIRLSQKKILERERERKWEILDSLKDPWSANLPFREGDILEGRIERIKPFGCFVRLDENFTGLVPTREMERPSRLKGTRSYAVGDQVKVMVLEVNLQKRQITLSLEKARELEERLEYEKYLILEEEIGSTGSLGWILQQSLKKD